MSAQPTPSDLIENDINAINLDCNDDEKIDALLEEELQDAIAKQDWENVATIQELLLSYAEIKKIKSELKLIRAQTAKTQIEQNIPNLSGHQICTTNIAIGMINTVLILLLLIFG